MSDYKETYRTIQGDMWDSIAYKLYGNEKYMKELMDANLKYIDYVVFPAGINLNVPKIAAPSTGTETFPLWRT